MSGRHCCWLGGARETRAFLPLPLGGPAASVCRSKRVDRDLGPLPRAGGRADGGAGPGAYPRTPGTPPTPFPAPRSSGGPRAPPPAGGAAPRSLLGRGPGGGGGAGGGGGGGGPAAPHQLEFQSGGRWGARGPPRPRRLHGRARGPPPLRGGHPPRARPHRGALQRDGGVRLCELRHRPRRGQCYSSRRCRRARASRLLRVHSFRGLLWRGLVLLHDRTGRRGGEGRSPPREARTCGAPRGGGQRPPLRLPLPGHRAHAGSRGLGVPRSGR
mmetsp:Transcript_24894/g.78802  ORF Transcript_24894/g.78802 Transcript_24894/m.78802 type:complete len:271 (-) Transcript_24894:2943-3755(-)